MNRDFDVYAVGSFGPPDEWNPAFVAAKHKAWPWLRLLKDGPCSAPALAERSRAPVAEVNPALEALNRLGVVRRSGDQYILGFGWFRSADQEAVERAVLPVAAELAGRIYSERREIDRHIERLRAAHWSDPRDLRFALVGCFGLDWGGLAALKASGHLVHEKEQPGDRRYVMYVLDHQTRQTSKDYAGSHSVQVKDRFTWSSFGDHSGERLGLPNLLFQLQRAVAEAEFLPAERRPLLGDLVWDGLYLHLDAAAEALVGLVAGRPAEGVAKSLLEAAGAVSNDRPVVPVFFQQEDGDEIAGITTIVTEAVLAVIREQYVALERGLADLAALRNGVPFGECFNYVWHVLFGHVNRILAEQGYLADPEPQHPGEGRYRWWLTVS